MRELNATFHVFKPSDKWYSTDRGVCPREVFEPYLGHGEGDSQTLTRQRLLDANDGYMPGLAGEGHYFRIVVILDDVVDFGYPITLRPVEGPQ